jgi:methionine aminotransferase
VISIESKLPKSGTTIFSVMTRLAEQHDAVNLSQGFPDFQPPEQLVSRVTHYLDAGMNQYPPMPGVMRLREAIRDKLSAHYGATVDAESEITVTSGATEALFCAVQAIVRPGDRVIVLDPAYDSYEPAVTLAGAETVHVPLVAPSFEVDWNRLESELNDRTRLVIINSPHNPTATLLETADLDGPQPVRSPRLVSRGALSSIRSSSTCSRRHSHRLKTRPSARS